MGNDNVKDYPPYLDYPKPQTNADRIRSMTDEELAKCLSRIQCPDNRFRGDYDCSIFHNCGECWLDWLKQEVSNG